MFSRWKDPKSGIESYLLSKRVATLQQSFYFVNPSFSKDGRFFWFYCAFPPGGSANQGRTLGVIDLEEDKIRHFPETAFTDASPLVDLENGEVYWCSGLEIFKRGPWPDSSAEIVNCFPESLARKRRPWRLATHLTFSADRKAVNLDVEIATEWFIGHSPLDGGEFVLWQKFDRCYNHAQFSPTDPDLQLIAQDHSLHPLTGDVCHYENRLWLIRRGQTAEPLFPEPQPITQQQRGGSCHHCGDSPRMIRDARTLHGHEWWGRDGRHVWYLHYGEGVKRLSLDTRLSELIWRHPTLSHAHCDALEHYLVADNLPPDNLKVHKVVFRNLKTGREVDIASFLPQLPRQLSKYHIHPHPQFCLNDQWICYTTTIRGTSDVAFVSVDSLIERTS